jgi:hypothetical protein
MAPITSEQQWQRDSYLSKEAAATRNYIFVNADDKTSHYLLPNNDRMVLELTPLRRGGGMDTVNSSKPVQWLYCRVVTADTNHDGRLTDDDGYTIAFANADGSHYQEVTRPVNAILGQARPTDDRLLLFYTSGGRHLVSEINIRERRLTTTRELPRLPGA